ncbi:caffeoylshikimate esterase-like isoform X2 [Prosopis cineraria]|uniref:caffeoylshikimate esterase-like isoform X2 n=1 Tax=Prosopis cineraria TaxID=364024 RepID=UPI00240F5D43|nr:caffeoylshikimate esterase-like isoform X2 [Prosopis cineraria]
MDLKPSKLYRRHYAPLSHVFRASVSFRSRRKRLKELASRMRFPGVDDELQRILDANMDEVPARRRAREAFKHFQLGIDHMLFKTPCDGLKMKESYEVNSRGIEIFTKSWLPETSKPKAAVFYCHGYADTCTFFFEGIARKLVSSGYGVFAMDYPGFGLSEGLHCYIPSFDTLVDDVIEHYSKVKENPEIRSLPCFLFGQSMGGAVVLKMHLKQPKAWDGAILVAPMCKIADDMTPPWLLTQILIGVANVLPKQKLVPQKDLAEAAFRELKKRELVSLPLLILHGEADTVTDPSVSKLLHRKASSSEKKLKLYDHAYHSLLEGEPDEVILEVFKDIIAWLDDYSSKHNSSSS